MADPYLGEIRLVAFNMTVRGWADCDGQSLKVTQYQALYALLGNRFGGDGRTTFQLPDLRGRTPLHVSLALALGTAGGVEAVTLTLDQMPNHTHTFAVSTAAATAPGVAKGFYAAPGPYSATSGPTKLYAAPKAAADVVPFASECLEPAGGSQAHSNMQPYLALKYIIAVQGIYPPRPN
ncbi:tail fiber protein [Azorhizobium sp. AG788]|uniref:phage tail protein n=1 Tax=Azorhizobium sp. AG788 TaxID=2183897 RepID=UPI003138A006